MNNEFPSYYAIIPATLRYDENIIPNAKLLYGEITCLSNKEGYCYATNSYFAKLYHVTNQAISRWIKSLVDGGYVSTQLIYKGKEVTERRIYISDRGINKMYIGINKKLIGVSIKSDEGYQQKVKDNNINNNIINNNKEGTPSKKFIKPTVEEIRSYINEKGYKIDPESFYDFYESKGWKIGKSSMKDWRACVRTWSHRDNTVASCRRGTVWEDESKKASDNLQTILNLDNNF